MCRDDDHHGRGARLQELGSSGEAKIGERKRVGTIQIMVVNMFVLCNIVSRESKENDYHGLGKLSGGRDLVEST